LEQTFRRDDKEEGAGLFQYIPSLRTEDRQADRQTDRLVEGGGRYLACISHPATFPFVIPAGGPGGAQGGPG
jgi:hypothetical protein